MWRSLWGSAIFKHGISAALGRRKMASPQLWLRPLEPVSSSSPPLFGFRVGDGRPLLISRSCFSFYSTITNESQSNTTTSAGTHDNGGGGGGGGGGTNNNSNNTLTCAEAKKLMRLVNVEALKMKLGMEGKEVIPYSDLLLACQTMGLARSSEEAATFARVLDDAGVVLLFRDKVYLHPRKVVDLVRRAVPLVLTSEDDPTQDELKKLQDKKVEIDVEAHKQVRCVLWCGLGLSVIQVALFIRLTFWEFSWDIMEPIAFFVTATGIVIGYAYFLITANNPTYVDLTKRLFLSRQRKLFKKYNFDVKRFKELQKKCQMPLDATTSIKNRVGWELELEDSLNKD